jgi:hypothetical protein
MDIDKILERSAQAFEAVARMVQQQGLALESHSVLMASSVNAGLALEFYAKCLSQLTVGHYPRTHSLQAVLRNLPTLMQSDLSKAFNDSVTDEKRGQIRQVETHSGTTIDVDFDSIVDNWSRVFVEGRYWFESSGTNSTPLHWFFFDELIRVMKDAIVKQRATEVD